MEENIEHEMDTFTELRIHSSGLHVGAQITEIELWGGLF